MYDLSSKFNTFYRNFVVLPLVDQNNLKTKANINIDRLKRGLEEYNSENKTHYSVVETSIQGSVAMYTCVQNESSDYDIDVAVVIEKRVLGDIGPRAARNIIANALKRRTKLFNAEPEVKTSCVRVKYSDGYHIDFAIFRREVVNGVYVYEHAGADWQKRDITSITDWFSERNEATEKALRRMTRLSKMFCSSRTSWRMPSGIVQTVVIDECLASEYSRLDEMFYWTMKAIINRIDNNTAVCAPADGGRQLINRDSDRKRMINWKNRLESKLSDLEVLFASDCSESDAISAWAAFFNHSYWEEQANKHASTQTASVTRATYSDTEEYIEELFPVNLVHDVKLSCVISGNGFRPTPIGSFLGVLRKFLPHNLQVKCTVESTTVSNPDAIFWKVRNVGPTAVRKNDIRGQIQQRGYSITENTRFFGAHYIECYVIKNGICVARRKINVPIGHC